jgi:hypothetical protein
MKLWQRIVLNMLFPPLIACTLVYLEIKNVREAYFKINLIEAIDDLDISLLELRRYEKNVLLFKDESQNLNQYNDYINKFKKGILHIESQFINEMGSADYSSFTKSIELYENDFFALHDHIIKKQKLVEDIRKLGRDMEKKARDKGLAYEIRRHEKNYLIYKEKEAADDVHRLSGQLSKHPGLSPVITLYINMFNDILQQEAAETETIGRIRNHARNMEKILYEFSKKTHGSINVMLYNAESAFVVTSVVVILCAILFSFLLSKGIVRTLMSIDKHLYALFKGQPQKPIVEPDAPVEIVHFINTYNLMLTKVQATQGKLDTMEAQMRDLQAQLELKQQSMNNLNLRSAEQTNAESTDN